MTKLSLATTEGRLIASAGLILLTAALAIASMDVVSRIQAEAKHNAAVVLSAQDTASTENLTAAIKDISESDALDPAFTLAPSEIMLIMTLSITNKTQSVQDFIPTNDLYIRTREGDYRPLHPSLYLKNQIGSGKIKPGETFTGQISFGVPKASARPLLYIDTQWGGAVPVVFDVLKQN